MQRLADEVRLGGCVGIAIIFVLLRERHFKCGIVIGKSGVLTKNITETHSVVVSCAIWRAKINAQTGQRIRSRDGPDHKSEYSIAMPRSAWLEPCSFHACPAVLHEIEVLHDDIDIDLGLGRKIMDRRTTDMLDAVEHAF